MGAREGRLPRWYVRRRLIAERLYRQDRAAKYGLDLDLEDYAYEVPVRDEVESLRNLPAEEREALQSVGVRDDENYRAGTYLQHDRDVVYLRYKDRLVGGRGLIVTTLMEAVRRYPQLRTYWFRACPLNLDKYTAFVGSYETAGAFIWSQEGVAVPYPIQACLFMEASRSVQVPHNIIIAEPNSSIHIITGCTAHPRCVNAAHIACTEIYVKRGAEVTWTMIHRWGSTLHVRPRMGAIVEEGGTLRVNYVLTSAVKSIQAYPTVILRDGRSRAGFTNLILGVEDSDVDIGSAIIFNAREGRGEIVTRAVVMDKATVKMRGRLWGRRPEVRGHLECKALLLGRESKAQAYPTLQSDVGGCNLTHEAAIGKISEDEMLYLMARGLTREEATSLITRGFLDVEIPGLPGGLSAEVRGIIMATMRGM